MGSYRRALKSQDCRAHSLQLAISLSPFRGLAHSDVTDQSPLLIGRHTLCPVYHAAFLPYRDQSSFPILPIHTRWLETAVYPRPMYGLRHAPCTGPARGLTHRRPPAPSSCCTGPATRLTPSPAASCLFTLHRPDFRRLPYSVVLPAFCSALPCPSMPTHRASTPGQKHAAEPVKPFLTYIV